MLKKCLSSTFIICFAATIFAQNNLKNNLLFASDLDCLIHFEHKLSNKEATKVRQTLIALAQKSDDFGQIYATLLGGFPQLKLDKTSIQNGCKLERLYTDKEGVLKALNNSENKKPTDFKGNLSEQTISDLTNLLQLRTTFLINYAYFEEKKAIFNDNWQQALDKCLTPQYREANSFWRILNALEDPHVGFKTTYKGSKNEIPCISKNKGFEVFPFHFKVVNSEFFVDKRSDPNHKLINDDKQIEDGTRILEINGLAAKVWIDSIDAEFTPAKSEREYMVQNMLFLYYFCEGETKFKMLNLKDSSTFVVPIKRTWISKEDFVAIFQGQPQNIFLPRPHFKYVRYYEQSNKSLEKLLESTELHDTLVLDFRGYPTRGHDVYSSTQLLLGNEPQKVSFSMMKNPKTGCFDVKEDETYFSKSNAKERAEIQAKGLILYGIIDGNTASYVETSVMTLKTYLPKMILIGQPTAGAFGTIDFGKIGKDIDINYPYHKFDFYEKSFINNKNQILPAVFMSKKEIIVFMKNGFLPVVTPP